MSREFKPLTLGAFLKIKALRPLNDGYVRPTPQQIKSLRVIMRWSQVDVAKITGSSYNAEKNYSSTVGKWEQPITSIDNRTIPYATWRLLLLTAGIVQIENNQKEDN